MKGWMGSSEDRRGNKTSMALRYENRELEISNLELKRFREDTQEIEGNELVRIIDKATLQVENRKGK